jgi:hypothetical protein
MEELADSVNSGRSYSGTYFKLTRDLTGANDTVTTAVGNDYYYFSGIFDGGGHEIAVNNRGLFYFIWNAVVRNLGVGGVITAPSFSSPQYSSSFAGAICGIAASSEIINCWNRAEIELNPSTSSTYVGGICGYTWGTTIISNCCNTGTVSSYAKSSYVGGICGDAFEEGSISDCYNTGTIFSAPTNYSHSYAGGICAFNHECIISNCYNTGTVSSLIHDSHAGGISSLLKTE